MSDKAYQSRAAPQIIKVKQDKIVENEKLFSVGCAVAIRLGKSISVAARNVATFSCFSPVIRTFFSLSLSSVFSLSLSWLDIAVN